ncbi:MAG: response regulator, partial [Chloroflexi bacterium]|nr:response regulator [Chloroflexota bacterium]
MSALLAAPIRHRGAGTGHIVVAGSEPGEEFSSEDEETLVMFASQSALVIANSRRLRDERRARADLESLIETSPVGVVVFEARTGQPRSFNREARRLAEGLARPGQSPEEVLDTLTIRRADRRETALPELPLARLMSAGEMVRAEEMTLLPPGGGSVTVLVNATPIRPDGGDVESYVVTLQDLTELEQVGRLRAEFLAIVSHELRAPLTSIKGSAATLRELGPSLDPAETLQFHRIIEDHADHMQGLITDLLDVARIEIGELAVFPQPTDVSVLVDSARTTFLSGGGVHDIHLDIEPDLPAVTADRRRIAQVLGNLLANAAGHSPESSGIRVIARRHGVHVEISVADDGAGISAERLPGLFRRFAGREGDDEGNGLAGAGSGLGLAICKGIVEAHGGRIRADSDGPGRGARLTFTLPAVDAPGHATRAEAAQPYPWPGRSGRNRIRILVVDDDPQTLRSVRGALSDAGYAPSVTGNPEEVGRLIEETRPHLVLLDLMLPGTDGIEMLEKTAGLSRQPVIFLSASGGERTVARALEAGADDYIVKPFSPTELTARIGAALSRRTEPHPFVLGELAIDYDNRRVTLAGRYVEF